MVNQLIASAFTIPRSLDRRTSRRRSPSSPPTLRSPTARPIHQPWRRRHRGDTDAPIRKVATCAPPVDRRLRDHRRHPHRQVRRERPQDRVGPIGAGPNTSGLLTFNSMTDFSMAPCATARHYTQSFLNVGRRAAVACTAWASTARMNGRSAQTDL